MIPYVLGIDSGGTKYLVRAVALSGVLLAEFKGPTCSHYGLGVEKAAQRTNENINRCLAIFGGKREHCARIVCGAAGLDSEEDGEILNNMYSTISGFICPIYCVNDVELAHYAATGGVGVLVLAGTGSIAFGRNKHGKEQRVGGWLRSIMGDEGSGRYIDACALQHYSRWLDNCCPSSPLLQEIEKAIGTKTRKGLMDYAVQLATPPWEGPNLGVAVNSAALAGDTYAHTILKRAARWNFELVNEVIKQLNMEEDIDLRVGIWGSVLINSVGQQKELEKLLTMHYPTAALTIPEKSAVQSAVEIAVLWHKNNGACKAVLMGKSN